MAELAGLVVGGAGLATLFDACMSAFEYFDTGRQYGEDYQRAALRLSVLRLKLSRWGACVTLVDNATELKRNAVGSGEVVWASEGEAEVVRGLLGDIGMLLEKAERTSLRYADGGRNETEGGAGEDESVQRLVEKTRKLALNRQTSATFSKKARWALHDKQKLDRLISDLREEIEDLTILFPTLQPAQHKLATQDAVELVQPSEVEENSGEVDNNSAQQIERASRGVDQDLFGAVEEALAARGHVFRNTIAREDSRLLNGDVVLEPGMVVSGRKHVYDGIYLEGNARVHNGDQYGGKGIFDD